MIRLARYALLLTCLGCGANVVFGEDGGDGGAGGDGAGGAGPSSGGAGPSSGGGGATTGIVTATIVDAKLGANCQPEVGPDPIFGAVLVSYENLGSTPGSLELVRADLLFATQVEGWVFPLALTPLSSGVIAGGAEVQLELSEGVTPGDSSFVCSLCGLPGSVQLTWRAASGAEVSDAEELVLECAF